MNLHLFLVVTDAERFLRGDLDYSLSVYASDPGIESWQVVGEIDVELTVDTGKMIEIAKAEILSDKGKHTAALEVLDRRLNELLALPAPGGE